jgi:membrane dipeptidase
MGDDMIVELAKKDGVIMINFGSSFLSQEANVYRYGQRDAYQQHLADNGLEASDEEEAAFKERWEAEYGLFPFADVEDALDHFDHVVDIAGIDHVGIGSDYDGVGDTLPTGLKDVSTYPVLIEGLLRRGYSEEDIRKILGENLLRVWESVERIAAAVQ